MKILYEDYTFDSALKTVTFNSLATISLEQLLLITNVTTNTIIYNFASPDLGGTVSGNTLTLDYNTATMSSTDKLQIFLDNLATPASQETLEYLSDQTALLGRMVKLLEPSSRQNTSGMQQISIGAVDATMRIDAYQMATTFTTLTAAESAFVLQSRIAYATLRQHLEFS